jgi:hypothetical protein
MGGAKGTANGEPDKETVQQVIAYLQKKAF